MSLRKNFDLLFKKFIVKYITYNSSILSINFNISTYKLFFSKKAIGPIVAIGLLLVVSVIAVVGFQIWFNNYQSSILVDSQTQTNQVIDGSLDISQFDGKNIYIQNNIEDNLKIIKLKISDTECFLTQNLTFGINSFDISSCTDTATDITDITLITENKVIQKTFYIDNIARLDCSNLNGGEWIKVPGNPSLGTNDFCVMKYEAKWNGSGTINNSVIGYCGNGNDYNISTGCIDDNEGVISQPNLLPLRFVNQFEAKALCNRLGSNYHLITNAQWITIARNIEQVDSNWNSGVVYVGSLKRGNTGDDVVGVAYDGLPNLADRSIDTNTLALLNLSNGEGIWDFSGNLWEWTSDTLPTSGILNSSLGQGTSEGWTQWTSIPSLYNYLKPANSSLTSANGIGQVYYDGDSSLPIDSLWNNIHAFSWGGNWHYTDMSGVFSVALDESPSRTLSVIGFRCSYSP